MLYETHLIEVDEEDWDEIWLLRLSEHLHDGTSYIPRYIRQSLREDS